MKPRFFTIIVIVAIGLRLAHAQPTSSGPQPQAAADRSSVLILGVGTPRLTAERSGTSIGIAVRGTMYIFDAGPGVERRMLEARARSLVKVDRFGPVFITHLHSDHTLGLPAMLYYDRNPDQPFIVFGPPGIKNMMTHIIAAYGEDRDIRVNGLEHANPVLWQTTVTEVTAGIVFQDANVKVSAFEVAHGNWPHALGYRIDTPDRSIVISGDTRPTDAIVRACNGCDILFHELGEWTGGPFDKYMDEFHTSPSQLGDLANRAKPKRLVLYHAVPSNLANTIRDITATFHGPVILARDLDVF